MFISLIKDKDLVQLLKNIKQMKEIIMMVE